MTESSEEAVVVLGAGPAGLTAAYELSRLRVDALVLEQDEQVGGISRTVNYRGYRFDIGGHRFFTKVGLVQKLWEEVLGEDFLTRRRLSRIYYRGLFFDYPLRPLNALRGLGLVESIRIGLSYFSARLWPCPEENNFEEWVSNRFGRRLYEIFFKTYTEKVWGLPCTEIGADWAAQRIKNLDLMSALKNAVLGAHTKDGEVITTLIDRFQYPRHGPGMMWERCRDQLESSGIPIRMGTKVTGLRHSNGKIVSALVDGPKGTREEVAGREFISSMPLRSLLRGLDPSPPDSVMAASEQLRYRDFLTVILIVDRAEVFPDNWIYIHSPEVRLGRIQNFKNWSPEMVPDPKMTSLGLEYFVQVGDDLWSSDDKSLIRLGERELITLGLIGENQVVDGTVVRMPKAYPVYDHQYLEALSTVREYLEGFSNLQTVGRNGQHRYNNQDHSMLTGIWAARNVAGEKNDVWSVNVEQEYHEEVSRPADRAVPSKKVRDLEEVLDEVFARFDPLAMGVAVGSVAALALYVATTSLLIKGGEAVGPNLSLLGQYLFGFSATWRGALIGALEAGILGYLFGFSLGSGINRVVGFYEKTIFRELELAKTLDPLEGS
jgi:protoporphyrinogen oxidase